MPGLYDNGAGNVTVPAGSTSGLYQLSQDINVLQDSDYGNANVAAYLASGTLTSNVVTTGNISGQYILGNGSQLTGLPATYNDSNVTTLLANFGSNVIVTTGNVTGGYFIGDGSQLTNLPASSYGNANVSAYLASGTNTANIVTTGNVAGQYILGDGSQLTNLPVQPGTYGNANVAAYLPTYTGNLAGGNIAVTNNANVGGNLTVAGTIFGTFSGNITGNIVVPGANTQVLFNNDGNVGANPGLTFNKDSNALIALGNVRGSNVIAIANVVAGGINTDNYRYANGTPISFAGTYGDSNVTTLLSSFGSNTISTTGNVTGGNLIATTNIVGGNVVIPSGKNLLGDFNGSANISKTWVETNVGTNTYFQVRPNSASSGLSSVGAFGSNNVGNTNFVGIYANASASYIRSGNVGTSTLRPLQIYMNASEIARFGTDGNVGIGNTAPVDKLSIAGTAYISGNTTTGGIKTDNYYYANGTPISFGGTYGDSNVTTLLNAFGSNTITTTGNVTAGNVIGNGQFLTNLPGANVTGTVANATYATSAGSATTATSALTANTVTDATQANITTVGTLTSLTVGGNADITGNLIVGQNLVVNGNTTSINITELNVEDPIISQGRGANNTPLTTNDGKDRGEQFWYYSGTEKSAFSGYDNSAGKMLLATDVSIANEIVTVNSLGNIVGGNIEATSVVTSGNVTASYVVGNGSLLSSLTGANVVGTVANATFATDSAHATVADSANAVAGANVTGTVASATQANTANVANSVSGSNVVGAVANATFATSAASATTAATVTTNAQPNITSVGTLSTLSVTGNITTGGILTDGYYYANGTPVTFGGGSTYGNANVATFLANFGSNTIVTTGNITGGNLSTTGQVTATGNITGSRLITTGSGGSITGADFVYANTVVANSSITTTGRVTAGVVQYANVDGTAGQVLTTYGNGVTYFSTVAGGSYGDSNVVSLMSAFGSNTITTTGNVTVGNLNMTGQVFDSSGVLQMNASGNIVLVPLGAVQINGPTDIIGGRLTTGAVTYANTDGTAGQVLTTYGNGVTYFSTVSGGSGSPGGANTQIQFNDGGAFAGNAAMTFDKVTGNITLGNIVVALNQQLETVNAFSGNSSVRNPGQITVGDGYGGNITNTTYLTASARGSRLLSYDQYVKTDNGQRNAQLASLSYADLNTGNIGTANANSRLIGLSSELFVINGNTVSTNPAAVRATQTLLFTGTSANVGNANVSGCQINYAFAQVNNGSRLGNVWMNAVDSTAAGGTTAPLDTFIGYGIRPGHTANATTGNVFGVYMPGTTNVYGQSMGNVTRQAGQYYFLRNDDDLAQNKLGSLRTFHEYRYDNSSSSGTLTVDKNNGQVQYISVTENITTVNFSNFVVSASDGSTTDYQMDTVTLVFQQDATGRTITLPTPSTTYKYAGGTSTMGSSANAVQMISVSAVYNAGLAGTQYLITVSPEFV